MIKDNTFAAACYNQNTIEELKEGLSGPADQADMKAWGLTADEWRQQIQMAINQLQIEADDLS